MMAKTDQAYRDNRDITRVEGILVGHAEDPAALTGCTVVLCAEGAVGGVDVRGAAPGTRETDLLRPGQLVEQAHAILLTGGSAFGLDAAAGVMRFLEERGCGFPTPVAVVPIVPAAVIFDLGIGSASRRPDAEMGYQACLSAGRGPVREGNAGATIGKILGPAGMMKGGVGTWSVELADGITVGAIVVVNAFGDVLDWRTGRLLAGARHPVTGELADTAEIMKSGGRSIAGGRLVAAGPGQNTTIGVVATDATLTKAEVNRLALLAHDGLARSTNPPHTMFDGDTMFALATSAKRGGDLGAIGAAVVEVVAEAVRRAALSATGAGGIPAYQDLAPTS
jgi:L-aminopeptidase/D-esterase-like protein